MIQQTRVLKIPGEGNLHIGDKIQFIVSIDDTLRSRALNIGFQLIMNTETILPRIIGPVTMRNAEGFYNVLRDLPKETYTVTVFWNHKEWRGKGDTEEVESYVDRVKKRFQRQIIPPYSIELSLVIDAGNVMTISSPELEYNNDNKEIILHTANLMLECFGMFSMLINAVPLIDPRKIVKLNWSILPKGEYPWSLTEGILHDLVDSLARKGNRPFIKDRLDRIGSASYDYIAIGNGGFHGYVIFVFETKNIAILESTHINNATYVFDQNWKDLSRLTKKQILDNRFCVERLVHHKNWFSNIDTFIQ